MPTNLTSKDCLVDPKKHPTIEGQRDYFKLQMKEMARIGHDAEDGWAFFTRTQMKGLSAEEQLEVFHRTVDWSESKQLRSREETKLSPDEVSLFSQPTAQLLL